MAFTNQNVKINAKSVNELQGSNEPFTPFTREEQDPHFLKESTTIEFKRLKQAFADWLRLLNFEPSTLKYAPTKLQEFLYWLETQNITDIATITRQTITQYFDYLLQRPNKRKGGRLSKNSLRTHLTNLRKFARYLRESGQESFDVSMQITGKLQNIKEIFTKPEIAALYESTGSDILGLRDKAILAVYYGCGLRRSEGLSLDVKDVLLDRNLLYVRKGKNYKERYVPMTAGVIEDLKNYIECARPILLKRPTHALFIAAEGQRITGNTMINRLHQLKEKAGIDKDAGLHSLRHSIATHLLQSGMELEKIKQFLGHSSLESTQIYTHIVNERE
jgi:site-specific recombinase XerD